MDKESFLNLMWQALLETDSDIPDDDEYWNQTIRRGLEEFLADEGGIEVGDEGYDWNMDAARIIVDDWIMGIGA